VASEIEIGISSGSEEHELAKIETKNSGNKSSRLLRRKIDVIESSFLEYGITKLSTIKGLNR
jgi:hypothetical protein